MDHHSYTPIDELRDSTRFLKEPESVFAAVFYPGDVESLAEVHSESLGGISLWLNEVGNLHVGRELSIAQAGSLMHAVVRHIQPHTNGRWIVGFACERIP